MNDKQRENWLKIRAKGQLRFIFLDGIIKCGIPFALFMTIFYYFHDHGFITSSIGAELTDTTNIYRFLFYCIFFGLLMGLTNWYLAESKFKNHK